MGELIFVGLGLGSMGVSLEGVAAIKRADVCYLEYYTTPHEPALLHDLESATGKQFTIVDRAFLEDGRKPLEEADKSVVVVAVPGDPMIATTHNDLRVRAISRGINTSVVHAATIASAAASASGLHYYKFGKTITVTRDAVDLLEQVYHVVHENLKDGLHTLLLLEVDVDSGRGVSPEGTIRGLLKAEANFKRDVVSDETFAIVLNRIGRPNFKGDAGPFSKLKGLEHGEPPSVVVIPGTLHFTETEAIAAIFSQTPRDVHGNSDVKRTAQVLIPRYLEKTRKAFASARPQLGKEYDSLLENVELYMRDAEEFLGKGEDELAMLNIGYAEGLLDSVGFTGKAKIEW
ncbi:MAG: diphthine synthase [Thaumarchaeota archaeon]|nr:diphthine synthase [Nitrososphaerota archaeon]